jgi:nickel transport protein
VDGPALAFGSGIRLAARREYFVLLYNWAQEFSAVDFPQNRFFDSREGAKRHLNVARPGFNEAVTSQSMRGRMKKIAGLAAVTTATLGLLTTSTVDAHGIWFAQRATQLALIYGVGADDLDSVKRLPLIRDVTGYDASWQPVKTSLRVAGPLLLVDSEGETSAVAAVLDNGIWSRTPDGEWVKKGRDEVKNATLSEKTIKYAVHINGPLSTALPALQSHTLQVVPVEPTLPALLGQPLKLRVLFQGKPVAGARVLHDFVNDPDGKPAKTAADGTVTIKVRNQGLNVVTAIFDGPADEPAKIDKIEHLATLSFVLPHAPE